MLRIAALLVTSLLMAGCAGSRAYRDGNQLLNGGRIEEGLAKLEQAVKLEPRNVEYRITLATRRAQAIDAAVGAAERAFADGRLTEAETAYRRVQQIDPPNPKARQGLQALIVERRHRRIVTDAESRFAGGGAEDLDAVLELLRPVLAENPNQREALNLKARVLEAKASREAPAAELAATFRKPITLEFRDAPLKAVFDAIAKVSGLNFFFDRDIRPDLKATVLARNTSIEDAVRLVLVTNQLEQRVLSRNSVLIYPNTPAKVKDYQTMQVRTFFLSNGDVKAVSNTLKTILKAQDLVVDERLGIIIMRDTADVIRLAEKLVNLQDLSDPEVMLDVEVLEVKRSRLTELGISWPTQVGLTPLAKNGETLTLEDLQHLNQSTTQVSIDSANATVRGQDDNADILANPRIRVRNKDTARILIGDRVPVITTTSTATGFVSDSVTYVDVGLKLEAEPNVHLDGDVSIKLHLEVSNLVREVTSKAGTLAYQIGTRTADTVLRLRDGETQVLAGLISDEDRESANTIPGLGDLPLLGRLFGSRRANRSRSEIVLAITPRLLRTLRRPDMVSAEFESGTQNAIGARSLTFASSDPETKEDAPSPAVPAASTQASSASVADLPAAAPVPASTDRAAPVTAPAPEQKLQQGSAAEAPGSAPRLTWKLPEKIKAGEQFTALLHITSEEKLRGLPMLLSFDPQALQVVTVEEGDFLKQDAGSSDFSSRVDPIQGRVFVAAVRQNTSGHDAGVSGAGTLLTVTFKAVRPAEKVQVQLLSVSPEPQPATPVSLPVAATLKIVP